MSQAVHGPTEQYALPMLTGLICGSPPPSRVPLGKSLNPTANQSISSAEMAGSPMHYTQLAKSLTLGFLLSAVAHTQSFAVDLRYTWTLPKTVIDATVVYTFQACSKDGAKFKITPTLVPRTIPDPRVGENGQKHLDPSQLDSFSQDKGISLLTFGGSRILNSIGSQPTSETGQIVGNILGGVAKLVAIGFGVAPLKVKPGAKPPPAPTCATGDDSGVNVAKDIEDLKANIKKYEKELANGADESTQKKDTAAIQAAQNLITNLQDQLTITIKTTIDPGVSPIEVDTDDEANSILKQNKDGEVSNSGLVAKVCPSQNQLAKVKWFGNLTDLFADNRTACEAVPSLEISIYLDFPNGHSTMYAPDHEGSYAQTSVSDDQQYRDVAYIPVIVWRGEKTPDEPVKNKEDGSVTSPVPLTPPHTLPFGQFGVAQQLPLSVKAFRTINWGVTFLEDGEITNATFSSKAWGLNATNLFGSAVSAANSIATEQRNATSPTTEATALQGQADLIYQTERLHLCQINPTNCPSK